MEERECLPKTLFGYPVVVADLVPRSSGEIVLFRPLTGEEVLRIAERLPRPEGWTDAPDDVRE